MFFHYENILDNDMNQEKNNENHSLIKKEENLTYSYKNNESTNNFLILDKINQMHYIHSNKKKKCNHNNNSKRHRFEKKQKNVFSQML